MKNKKLFAILTLVCFMMTLMPVAAFAANPAWDASAVYTVDTNAEANVNEAVELEFALNDVDGAAATSPSATMYIWATVSGSTAASSALNGVNNDNILVKNNVSNGDKVEISFKRAGKYTIHASIDAPTIETDLKVTAPKALSTASDRNTVTVTEKSVNPDTNYLISVNGATKTSDKTVNYTETLVPNNVAKEVKVNFYLKDATNKEKALTGKTVTIEAGSSSIDVDKTSVTTGVSGNISFKLSASHEGKYNVYLTVDGVTFTMVVNVSNTSAAYIETISEPVNPKALWGNLPVVRFQVTDINGNVFKATNTAAADATPVYAIPENQGMDGIKYNKDGRNVINQPKIEKGSYIVLTSAPSASKIKSSDFSLEWNNNKQAYDLKCAQIMDAEGTYAVKVILDNGAYATAKWEVKQFATPVSMRIDYPRTTVEPGASITPDQVVYVDANKVEKDASKDMDFAATGYAIATLGTSDVNDRDVVKKAKITVKTDEKYVGSTIDVTAVSERYNLVATATLTVADAAKDIAFATKTAEVNVNNKILWNVVDSQGNKVALSNEVVDTDISYVVLDKPADAKVSVYDATNVGDLQTKGEGKMSLTSNKIGNVTVQAILKAKYDTTNTAAVAQTKYYTGTAIFAVGNGSAGDVVVMSIGSHEVIVNDKKATIDAAPMIQNDRTFVPFRALAEAFGAEVAYDEATQAVTAKLNGVEVVMTIGSATYTVNGAEKTADVAPFINGSRTMVPVRFAAEAFGIKVIPTYNPDGTTADILFNL